MDGRVGERIRELLKPFLNILIGNTGFEHLLLGRNLQR